jgi:hypothetical protein
MGNAETHATLRRGGALRHVDFLVCGVRPAGSVNPWRWRDGGFSGHGKSTEFPGFTIPR